MAASLPSLSSEASPSRTVTLGAPFPTTSSSSHSSIGLGEAAIDRSNSSILVDQRGGAAAITSPPNATSAVTPSISTSAASYYLPAARSRLNSDLSQTGGAITQDTDSHSVDSHASSSNRIGAPVAVGGLPASRSTSSGISAPHPSHLLYPTLSVSDVLTRTNGDVHQALEDVLNDRNKFCQEAGKLSSENVRIWNLMGRIRKENEALKARLANSGTGTGSGSNGDLGGSTSSATPGDGSKAIATTSGGAAASPSPLSFLRSASSSAWNLTSPLASRVGRQGSDTNDAKDNDRASSTPMAAPLHLSRPLSIESSSDQPPQTSVAITPTLGRPSRLGAGVVESGTFAEEQSASPHVPDGDTLSADKGILRMASNLTSPSGGTRGGLEDSEESGAMTASANSVMQQRAAAKAVQQSSRQQLRSRYSSSGGSDGNSPVVAVSSSDDPEGVFGHRRTHPSQGSNSLGSHGEYTAVESSSIGGDDSIVDGFSKVSTPQQLEQPSSDASNDVRFPASTSAALLQSHHPGADSLPHTSTITPLRSIRDIRSASANRIANLGSTPSAWTDGVGAGESPGRARRKDPGAILGAGSSAHWQSPLGSPTSPTRPSMSRKASGVRLEPRDPATGSSFALARAIAEVASTGPPGEVSRGTMVAAASSPPQPRLNNALLKQVTINVHGTNIRLNERGKEIVSFFLLIELAGQVPARYASNWMVEKIYSDIIKLDATLRHTHGRAATRNMEQCQLPDRLLFKDHAPSRVDTRKIQLESYLQSLLKITLPEKDDYCTFLCTDVVPLPTSSTSAMTKEGYLTKKGQNLGRWVTRLYSLENGDRLDYLEGRGGAFLGSIDLRGAQIGKQQKSQSSESDENSYRHAFLILERKAKVHAKNGLDTADGQPQLVRHVLCAETDEERDNWVDVLVRAIGAHEKASRVEVSMHGSDKKQQQQQPPRSAAPFAAPVAATVPSSISALAVSRAANPFDIAPNSTERQQRGPPDLATSGQMVPSPSAPVSSSVSFPREDQTTNSGPVPAVLPNRPSRSGSLSRRFRPREGSISNAQFGSATPGDENSRRSRDGPLLRRGSTAAPEMPSSSSAPSRSSDVGVSSPNAKERAAKLGISGPVAAVPLPAGYKFGNREETSSDSGAARKDDKKRFWHRFGGNASTSSTGTVNGQPRPPVFGAALSQALATSGISPTADGESAIPSVVYRCIDFLERKGGLREEGIYRLSGSSTAVRNLRERFDSESDVDMVKEMEDGTKGSVRDPHAVAGLLKSYLRELPTSILTRDMHLDFLRVVDIIDKTERMRELAGLVSNLPRPNHSLLKALIQHLTKVTVHQDENKMTVRNVGIVFSPTLGIPAGLFALFLTTYEYCFGVGLPGAGDRRGPVAAVLPTSPSLEEDDSEGIKHSQVLQAVTAAEEAGSVDVLDEEPLQSTSTSRSKKRDSRMFSAADVSKLSGQIGATSYSDFDEEEEAVAERDERSQLGGRGAAEIGGRGSMNASRIPSGIDAHPTSGSSNASRLVATANGSGNGYGDHSNDRLDNRSNNNGNGGSGSGRTSSNGHHQLPRHADDERRHQREASAEDVEEETSAGVSGLPIMTTSRFAAGSTGGQSAASVLRKYRNATK